MGKLIFHGAWGMHGGMTLITEFLQDFPHLKTPALQVLKAIAKAMLDIDDLQHLKLKIEKVESANKAIHASRFNFL